MVHWSSTLLDISGVIADREDAVQLAVDIRPKDRPPLREIGGGGQKAFGWDASRDPSL